jgi:hypothetical protein
MQNKHYDFRLVTMQERKIFIYSCFAKKEYDYWFDYLSSAMNVLVSGQPCDNETGRELY